MAAQKELHLNRFGVFICRGACNILGLVLKGAIEGVAWLSSHEMNLKRKAWRDQVIWHHSPQISLDHELFADNTTQHYSFLIVYANLVKTVL